MVRLAANISTMFHEHPFPERIDAAARAGFRAVECQWPYDWDAALLARRLRANDIDMVLINAPAGNRDAGDCGIAGIPGREHEFRESVRRALDYAEALDCRRIHVLAGVRPAGQEVERCLQAYRENLRHAAELAQAAGRIILIEPINASDVPGYLICHTADALRTLEDVASAGLGLQYDMYHSHRAGEDIADVLDHAIARIEHIQISSAPGRHEPDRGEPAFAPLLALLDDLHYAGWVGCEYFPERGTLEGLRWAAPFGIDGGAGASNPV